MNSNYKRKRWHSAQDETFEWGCLFVIPYACFFLLIVTQLQSLQQILLFSGLIVFTSVVVLYVKNRWTANTMQRVFQERGCLMNRVVENVLADKQLPYETATAGREATYSLKDDDLEIVVGPFIYTAYKRNYGYQQIEDGVLVKIRGPKVAQNLLFKSIKRQIDERADLLNLT